MPDAKATGASGCGWTLAGFALIVASGLLLFVAYGYADFAAGEPGEPEHWRGVLSEMFGLFVWLTVPAMGGLLLGVIALTIGICSGRPRGPGASDDL